MSQIQLVRYGSSQDFSFAELRETRSPIPLSGEGLSQLIGGKTLGHSFQWSEFSNRMVGLRLPFSDQSSIVIITDWSSAISIGASLAGPRVAFLPRP
jgi:hypothetical protein